MVMKRDVIIGAALIGLTFGTASAQQSDHRPDEHQQVAQTAAGGSDQALPSGFDTTPLIKSGVTRDNKPIIYPKTDKPELFP
jgi:hypothetical protein